MATPQTRAAIEGVPLWYHTMEIGPGIVTPGWFDLRPVAKRLPWPDVEGKRCLDVGTYDGFFAFEMERRGAAEVTAVDIGGHEHWDWPPATRHRGPEYLRELAGEEVGVGFGAAREALGSAVERIELSVYDLDPAEIGRFDVVFCGSLMLHLRDPLRALDRIRSVCDGHFLSAEQIDLRLTVTRRRSPAARLHGTSNCQWWIPNVACHRRMLVASGFEVLETTDPYAVPLGPGHGHVGTGSRLRSTGRRLLARAAGVGDGVPHAAALTRPLVP